MTVYLDIVFIENILMNYIIMYASGIVMKHKMKKIRILLASIIGAIYTVLMYINILPIYSNIIMKFLLSIVITYVSFKPNTFKRLYKDLVIFYLVSFVFGGCVFALMYFLKPQMAQIRNGVFVGAYPIKIALIGGITAFIIIQISFKIVKNKISKKDMIIDIEIIIDKKAAKIKGLLDTGNFLKDPITGLPVIVVEKESLKQIISDKILNNLEKILGGDIDELTKDDKFNQNISRFRMIPFSSLGKQNGLLLGIKSDGVNIIIDGKIEKNNNVIIGIYDKSFTKNNMYSAILGLDILEGGKTNECIADIKI